MSLLLIVNLSCGQYGMGESTWSILPHRDDIIRVFIMGAQIQQLAATPAFCHSSGL